ncbi:hypothetical protein CASFOL_042393 [Castilleja foliolosa]|uniref:Uncharacterized protein n=1 Tax=Castilleja foliolosa TaxID=1961234 RepID=A0ABD3BAM5_9LAMI
MSKLNEPYVLLKTEQFCINISAKTKNSCPPKPKIHRHNKKFKDPQNLKSPDNPKWSLRSHFCRNLRVSGCLPLLIIIYRRSTASSRSNNPKLEDCTCHFDYISEASESRKLNLLRCSLLEIYDGRAEFVATFSVHVYH